MTGEEIGHVARGMLEALAGEPLPDWPAARSEIRGVRLSRGEALFRSGQPGPFVYFVRRGLVKLCYETANGDEWIKGFTYEGRFCASIGALRQGGCAGFSAFALEASELERIDYPCLLRLAETHVPWQRAVRRGLEVFGERKEERERELLTMSARDRYLAFARDNPALLERVPQKDLARYLGITPVGLSRMRGRMATQRADSTTFPGTD